MKNKIYQIVIVLFVTLNANGQNFSIYKSDNFSQKLKKKVILFNDSLTNNKLIFFKTKLEVNTDGTPISYHPYDLRGNTKAINNIGNAIVVTKDGSNENLCISHYSEAISVFEKFRDSNYEVVPKGYKIIWQNVLIAETINGIKKPCVIKIGKYSGYFSSGTSLKNGLSDKGECECNNQVNPLEIPAFVIPKGNNLIKNYGASVGDLLIAYNPINSKMVFAIINDEGPNDKLGEGSVLLNMKLLDSTSYPKTKVETYQLATRNDIIITIIPKSKNYNVVKPFTIENINTRIQQILKDYGFESNNKLLDFILKNQDKLN
jgi:hypothetical protein